MLDDNWIEFVGVWGSGKSTAIKKLKNELKDPNKYKTTDYFYKLKKSKMEVTETKLNGIKKKLAAAGLQVRPRIEIGMPVREILKVEEEEDVSVTVIGSHGRSNLEEIFLGSVSEKVIRKSKNPVLVIKR